MMSNQTIRKIKFDTTTQTKFVDWLAKEKIFLESDTLSINRMATIGYLLKIHPRITNCTSLKILLQEELSNVTINPSLVVELNPSLETQQVDAMSNGDIFIPAPPLFKIFKTPISCRCNKEKVEADIFGIKCAIKHACLLKEFFTQLGTPMDLETCLGVFVPTSMVHMIGAEAYKKLLCDHNSFLQTIMTVPVGDFQHDTLKMPFSSDTNTDIETTTLLETILDQPWCISVEQTTNPEQSFNCHNQRSDHPGPQMDRHDASCPLPAKYH